MSSEASGETDADRKMAQVAVEVPLHTKEVAKNKLDHGGISRVVREALTRVAHGDEASELQKAKDRLQELRDKRRDLMRDREDINHELDQVELQIERVENRIDTIRDREGEYEGSLKTIEETLVEGGRVFPKHGMVQRAAEVGNCMPEDVIADLRERNPTVPDEQFREGSR